MLNEIEMKYKNKGTYTLPSSSDKWSCVLKEIKINNDETYIVSKTDVVLFQTSISNIIIPHKFILWIKIHF